MQLIFFDESLLLLGTTNINLSRLRFTNQTLVFTLANIFTLLLKLG